MTPYARILVIRHGDRWDFENPDKWENGCKQWGAQVEDPPLSMLGRRQAQEVAMRVQRDYNVDYILSSPYLRTLQTSQELAALVRKPIQIEDGVAEVTGCKAIHTAAERYQIFPEVDATYEPCIELSRTSTESYWEGFFQRIISAINKINERFIPSAGKAKENRKPITIVIFSHAASSVALIAGLLRCPLDEIAGVGPCSISEVIQETADGQWRLVAAGDASHLKNTNGKTRPWRFDDDATEVCLWNELLKANRLSEISEKKSGAK